MAQRIENGGGFFGYQSVFDDAVVAGEIDQAFGAQAREMVGNSSRRLSECFGQFGDAAFAVQQHEQNGHAVRVGDEFEKGRETFGFHSEAFFISKIGF